MPYVPPMNHAERVRRLMAGQAAVPPGADQARLAASYRRALDDYHLDPAGLAGPRIVSQPALRAICDGEEALLRAAGRGLAQLHEVVRESGYGVLLANADGVTVDCRVAPEQRKDFKRAGLYPGACWAEHEEGTCGIAAAVLDRAPITVHKNEHFRAAFTSLTCSAAPMFAPDGSLLGVLNASALASPDERHSQRLVHHLIRQSAQQIEDAYFLSSYTQRWVLLLHRERLFVEVQPELLLAMDGHGMVIAANRRARERLPILRHLPVDISAVFALRAERLFATRPGADVLALRLAEGGAWLHGRVRAPQVRSRATARPAAVTAAAGGMATVSASGQAAGDNTAPVHEAPLDDAALAERHRIIAALGSTQWRPVAAARLLGISRATLYRRLARWHIHPPHRQ